MKPKSSQIRIEGQTHRVYKKGSDVYVDHVEKHGGDWDVINLTDKSGAKTISQGVKAVRDWHEEH